MMWGNFRGASGKGPLAMGMMRGLPPRLDELRALINSLYGNGEQGAIYIPQPMVLGEQALFQSNFTFPAAAADGDPVGVGLDVGQSLEFELNIVSGWVNGTSFGFDSFASSGTGFVVSKTSADSFDGCASDTGFSVVAGEIYKVEIAVNSITGSYYFALANDQNGAATKYSNNLPISGSTTIYLRANTTGTAYLQVQYLSSSTSSIDVESVTIRKISGYHATQSVSADRPLHRTDGTLHWLQHDLAGDALVATLPDFGTNATRAFANASGTTITGGLTISGATTLPQEVELYGAIYVDGPLTTDQNTKVTDYLNSLRGA